MNLSEIRVLLTREGLLKKDGLGSYDAAPLAIGCDSKTVTPETLFFCKGVRFKAQYLADAAAAGACAYVSETEYPVALPHLLVTDVRKAMPLVAREFYGRPDEKYPLVGITGTKGKTSCAYQLGEIFRHAFGDRYGMITTNEARSCGPPRNKSGTTPEALDLYALLHGFACDGVRGAVMEVSSQGLQYDRVTGIDFAVGIYLNLSPDHISPTEHRDFEEYKAAKKRMLTLCRTGIVNLDDPYGAEMIAAATCPILRTVSLTDPTADYYASRLILTEQGMSFTVNGTDLNDFSVTLKMAGEFNVSNALCAIAAARALGIDPDAIRGGLANAEVKGRMEQFSLGGVKVIVDYAHNGLSFEKVFDYADRFHPDAKKVVVYGCPGNKALDRRTEMSDVAGRRADFVVLTDDDPAEEDPDTIMDQAEVMLRVHDAHFVRIHDRASAIAHALSLCRQGDLLLLLGKGHETGQAVRGASVPYGGDRACAEAAYQAALIY
ncbi:MAG: UDP-N-acetylmuramyl-tripeptide synthetase [Clostridia bacterium]|nr:UDP-N-acetylmuramyl-tripeptide synthetase [Clostridia bacterium]